MASARRPTSAVPHARHRCHGCARVGSVTFDEFCGVTSDRMRARTLRHRGQAMRPTECSVGQAISIAFGLGLGVWCRACRLLRGG